MIELYLSTDGKHTVHLSAMTLEETERLMPEALRFYRHIVKELGTKPALWEAVMNGKRSPASNGQNGAAHSDEDAPLCKIHQTPMVLQKGRFGAFWSCRQRNEFGRWCSVTQEA